MPPWMPGADSAPLIGREPAPPDGGGAADARDLGGAGRAGRQAFATATPRRSAGAGLGGPRPTIVARAAARLRPHARRRRDRRLPLLPARPEAQAEHVRHRRADPAAADGDRAPRDPLRGGRCAGDRRDAAQRRERRQGLDVLRRARSAGRPRRAPARSTASASRPGSPPGCRDTRRMRFPPGPACCCTRARRS